MKKILYIFCMCFVGYYAQAQVQSQNQIFTGNAAVDYKSTENNLHLQMQVGGATVYSYADEYLNAALGFPYSVLYISSTFTDKTFTVSKGYYGDKIQLDWSISANKDVIENTLIYKRKYQEAGNSGYFVTKGSESVPHESFGEPIAVLSNGQFQYIDNNIEGAVLYEYLVFAKGVSVVPEKYTTYITGIGYRNPTAVVSGNISFDGGSPVKDVIVRAEPEGAEINFGSSLKVSDKGFLDVKKLNKSITKEGTFQSWVQVSETADFSWLKLRYRDLDDIVTASNIAANVSLKTIDGEKQLNLSVKTNVAGEVYAVNLKKYYPTGEVDGKGDDILKPISEIHNSFVHLSLVLKENNSPKIFLNGRLLGTNLIETIKTAQEKESDTLKRKIPELLITDNYTYPANKEFNSLRIADKMNGIVDEIRLWKRSLNNKTIRQDFKRYLAGTETDLIMYLRANEGNGLSAYDLSAKGYEFNKNVASLYECTWTAEATERPTSNQLGILGVTDANGNYVIAAIPFAGAGESFNITPSYGVHEFNPNQQLIFLGEDAKVANKIDFNDISSFIFRGVARMDVVGTFEPVENVENVTQVTESGYNQYKVTKGGNEFSYEKGEHYLGSAPNTLVRMPNIGVADANVFIDGVIVLGDDNLPLKTDENGSFVISVPIGDHYIEVKKDKHTFTYGGRFPMNLEHALAQEERIKGTTLTTEETTFIKENHNLNFEFFEHQEQSVTFLDTTKVTLVGKVVGGSVEALKPIGFGVDGIKEHIFDAGTDKENKVTVSALNNIGQATIKLSHKAGDVLVTTNAETGEYSRELAPLPFIIQKTPTSNGITILNDTDNISGSFLDANEILNLSVVPSPKKSEFLISENDTLFSNPFHFEKSFVYRSDAQLAVEDQVSESQVVVGDEIFYIEDVKLLGKDLKIYNQGKKYTIDFDTHELYTNYDNVEPVEFRVPIEDGEFIITNNLSNGVVIPVERSETDKSKSRYTFIAGSPTISAPFLKTISIKYRANNIDTDAVGYNPEGMILGGLSDGSQTFVTSAPPAPDFILRDPPGTNSFATLEKGQSFSYTNSISDTGETASSLDFVVSLGTDTTVITAPLGVGTAQSAGIKADLGFGLEVSASLTNTDEMTTTYSFTETITTSAEPDFVGAAGDLYIGNALNYFYGSYDNIAVSDRNLNSDQSISFQVIDSEGNEKDIYVNKSKAMKFAPTASSTIFIYSQKHIVDVLIPDLELIISNIDNGIILESDEGVLSRAEYLKQVNSWKRNILENEKTKYLAYTDRNKLKEKITASIAKDRSFFPLGLLSATSAKNELEKLLDDNFYKNISFDAGLGEYTQSMETIKVTSTTREADLSVGASVSAVIGFDVMGKGTETTIASSVSYTRSETDTSVSEDAITISYTLSDNDESNLLSVDVINPFDGSGPIFITQGGRTSCPYEDATEANYLSKESGKALKEYEAKLIVYNKYITNLNIYNQRYNACMKSVSLNGSSPSAKRLFCNDNLSLVKPVKVDKPILDIDYNNIGETLTLSEATQRVEIPVISVEVADIVNIPADGTAEFHLILENNGVSTTAHTDFNLKIDTPSNPYGAIFNIRDDGQIVNVPAGEKVPFVLTIKKSLADQFEYKDIVLIFESLCDDVNTSDSVKLSATFVPSCSSVKLSKPFDNWVVNNEDIYNVDGTTNTLKVELAEFNTGFNSFKKIDLQYRKSTASSWNRLHTYYKAPFTTDGGDAVDYLATAIQNGEDKNSIISPSDATLLYDLDIAGLGLSDGKYDIRAISYCTDGTQFTSEPIKGTVDLSKPQQFGTPSPTDGILDAGEDLRLQFNEPIVYNSALTKLEIVAETNQLPINHAVSLYFNGTENNAVIDKTNVITGDYSIEFWMNNSTVGNATIMQQKNGFSLQLVNNELIWTLGGATVNGGSIMQDDLFHHYTLSYNQQKGELRIFEDSNELKVETVGNLDFTNTGKLTIGGNNFIGNLHDLRMWTKSLSLSESVATLYSQFTNSQRSLVGYWPMREGQGKVAKDLIRRIHAKVNASWDIKPKTTSYELVNNQYVALELNSFSQFGAAKQIDNEMDVTLSFWVKTDQQKAAALFTNGRGTAEDFVQSNGKRNKWSVELDNNGHLVFNNEAFSYALTDKSLADNSWHHVAIVVSRVGVMNTFINSSLASSHSSKEIGGISGNKFWIGARGFTNADASEEVDRIFSGKIDEVRLWNTARTLEQITRDSGYEIAPTTTGLVLYAPMNSPELVSVNGPKYYHALSNNTTPSVNAILSVGVPNYSDDAAKLKPKRNLLSFDVSYVINGDEIIITPEISNWAVLEGQILDITVDRLFDAAGNRQASPITWTAYVNKQEIEWYTPSKTKEIKEEKKVNDAYSFSMDIVNKGGKDQSYTISGVPLWMTTNKTAGAVGPDSSEKVTFVVDKELAMGVYTADIFLETATGFNDRLTFELRVLTDAPDWAVNAPDYSNSMNIIGKIKINEAFSRDKYSKIGVFVDNKPRGEAYLQYDKAYDDYFVFLTAYSNVTSGENLDFKIWDALNGKILTATINGAPNTSFLQNEVLGSKIAPTIFSGGEFSEQNISLNTGWTWTSLFVKDSRFNNVKSTFSGLTLQDDDMIKSQDNFTRFENNEWNGSLSMLENTKMYKIKLANSNSLELLGTAVDAKNINLAINNGWNWLPFPIHRNVSLQDALAFYNPTDGDVIKDQYTFAIYDANSGWSGSLNYMQSNRGYMMKSGASQMLNYPNLETVAKSSTVSGQEHSVNTIETFSSYDGNMSVVAEVIADEKYSEVIVYDANRNIRGKSPIVTLNNKKMSFISVFSNNNDVLQFVLSDEKSEVDVSSSFVFENNKVYGNMQDAVVLSLKSLSTEDVFLSNIVLYPNPFSNSISIDTSLQSEKVVKIEIFSTIGKLVTKVVANKNKTTIDTSSLARGMYLIKVTADSGRSSVQKMIKK